MNGRMSGVWRYSFCEIGLQRERERKEKGEEKEKRRVGAVKVEVVFFASACSILGQNSSERKSERHSQSATVSITSVLRSHREHVVYTRVAFLSIPLLYWPVRKSFSFLRSSPIQLLINLCRPNCNLLPSFSFSSSSSASSSSTDLFFFFFFFLFFFIVFILILILIFVFFFFLLLPSVLSLSVSICSVAFDHQLFRLTANVHRHALDELQLAVVVK